ncbi:MAG: hypothetical protein CFE34_01005 [Rhodobacteraceae bacterium PARR1]|nr:MAG: hypothetical protein CFE34_01005 [Rhodobacteraceae bacterium PARR1]
MAHHIVAYIAIDQRGGGKVVVLDIDLPQGSRFFAEPRPRCRAGDQLDLKKHLFVRISAAGNRVQI